VCAVVHRHNDGVVPVCACVLWYTGTMMGSLRVCVLWYIGTMVGPLCVFACVHVYFCVYMSVCIFACLCVHICVCSYGKVCTNICMWVCVPACVHVFLFMRMKNQVQRAAQATQTTLK